MREVYGISKGLVKWVDLRENNRGEGGILDQIGTKGKKILTLNNESVGSKGD